MKRTAGQVLTHEEIKNGTKAAATARVYAAHQMGRKVWTGVATSARISPQECLDVCKAKPHIHTIVNLANSLHLRRCGGTGPVANIAMIAYDSMPKKALEFIQQFSLVDEQTNPKEPCLMLYQRFLKARNSPSARLPTFIRNGLTAKAYNAFARGQDIGVLKWVVGDEFELVTAEDMAYV
jgi:hypothetical protein